MIRFNLSAALLRMAVLGIAALLSLSFHAHAQSQPRRVALVVGFSDYAGTPHPTALQDAGLVSQTLKQAGFDVSEAANLSQAEFRTLFRDFLDKAGAAGTEGTAVVYLSGYGLQDDGENILVPMGARLRQRADLAIDGLRLSDFLRALAALPLREKIAIIDAAYQHPLQSLVADGGRGFALAERQDGLLLAFNQSPGQAAPLPRTGYGHYAMALAEGFREPGFQVNAVFDRVRLRVHDLSQGAETPWHVSGLASPSMIQPLPGGALGIPVPPAPGEQDFAALRQRPLAELSPDEDYARAVEIDTIAAYEGFVKRHPQHAQARKVRATIAARREAAFWQRTRKANNERAYWTYLKHYPRGQHAREAQNRLERLSASMAPPAEFQEVVYDDLLAPPAEEIEIFEQVVVGERWEDVYVPFERPVAFLPPPPVEIIELAPPPRSGPRLLPAVVIGAGVVGAAILANRAWRRPQAVRPAYVQPVVRPPLGPRPVGPRPVGPGFGGPRPGVAPPGAIRPVPGAQVLPGTQVPLTRPGAIRQPGVQPVRPAIAAPQTAPTPPRTSAPAVVPTQPPRASGVRPGAPVPPRVVTPQITNPRVVTPRGPNRPDIRQPGFQRPAGPTIMRPAPPPQIRPVARPQPPQFRPPPQQVRPQAPAYRPPPPQFRPPPPQARPQPPIMRAPPPQAPAARPQQQQRPMQCTPQMRAQNRC